MYYIGLDVHKKTISFCVKDAAGRVWEEGKVGSTRRELDAWIETLAGMNIPIHVVIGLAHRRNPVRERRYCRVRQPIEENNGSQGQKEPPGKRRNPCSALCAEEKEDGECRASPKQTTRHAVRIIHSVPSNRTFKFAPF
jgi:hypothetical protein